MAVRDAGNVIDVRVGQEDVLNLQIVVAARAEQAVHLVAGIDDDPFTGALAAHDESVLVERRLGTHLEDHSLQSYT